METGLLTVPPHNILLERLFRYGVYIAMPATKNFGVHGLQVFL